MLRGKTSMQSSPYAPRRNSIRLPGYDYCQPGAYFVTICSSNRKGILGNVSNGRSILSWLGAIAERCWSGIPEHFPDIKLDTFVIMPNHLHGILWIMHGHQPKSGSNASSRNAGPEPRSLAAIVRSFKAATTK